MLSRGRCYNPECPSPEPIIKFRDGDPFIDYEIAHIRDAKPGNRFVEDMTDEERGAFANLVLLCTPCHKLVDKVRPQDFPINILEGWKRAREADTAIPLAAIGRVDDQDLAELLLASARAALGNPDLVVDEARGRVRVVGAGVPRLLPLEPATISPGARAAPTRLVRARSGVVPFTVHHDVLGSLLDWCTDGAAFSARIVGGRAGVGKTRLGVQLCEELAAFGWVRGLLSPEPAQPEVEALVAAPTARLVVVDYAETRAAQLAALLPRLAAFSTAERPVRALLLVRAKRGEDWRGPLRNVSDGLDALVDDMGLDVLGELAPSGQDRQALFASAAAAFSARAPGAPSGPPPPDGLDGAVFATPLLVTAAAYLAVHGGGERVGSRRDLLEELLNHEDRHWKATGLGPPPDDPVLRRRVVALATLAGATSEANAAQRLRLVPDLADENDRTRRLIARWADGLYGGPQAWWNPLEPDLVAEHLVATTYHDHPDVLAGVLAGPAAVVARPIGLYARAAPEHPLLAEALGPVLDAQLARLCDVAVEQAATETDREVILGQGTLAAALARWLLAAEAGVDALADAVDRLPPRSDLVLNPLAVVLTAQLVKRLRPLVAANPAAYEPALAMSLNNLSVRLAEAGRRAEGLAAVEEAVEVRRRLAAANPAAYEPDLAMSLNNLSLRLADAGRRDEAERVRSEAQEVERRVEKRQPGRFR